MFKLYAAITGESNASANAAFALAFANASAFEHKPGQWWSRYSEKLQKYHLLNCVWANGGELLNGQPW